MSIQPFHFSLRKVKSEEVRLLDALFSFLPQTQMREHFSDVLRESLRAYMGQQVSFHLESIQETHFKTFSHRITSPAALAVLGMFPTTSKLFVDIDPSTAFVMIDCMLGGKGENPLALRKLTDIEEGVLQFLLLQLMTRIRKEYGDEPRVHFRFERFASEVSELEAYEDEKTPVVILTVRLKWGHIDGFVRLCFPHPLLHDVFLAATDRPEEREYLVKTMQTYDYVKTSLWAEVGRTTLTPDEIVALEQGDVILFDESFVTLKGKTPTGKAMLRVGFGKEGGYLTDMVAEQDEIHCRFLTTYSGE
ncbi:MAG: hypothetical protein A3I05_03415 [Deltaproteobacteria bacterium RIFCSPLOWO2_02_FULL_44_10]|nr:MAG: hypothetical protein A3C46_02990 [Deltaproteobacteria bacterium RIFCSPHIGHO2_02_FULL_44_16]OGQ46222.1 MAG: hypothetical protein A3I05_03415 [Deltaproteobacteria bacterium RIFCSPLOWO2_02_FULL_44_10]